MGERGRRNRESGNLMTFKGDRKLYIYVHYTLAAILAWNSILSNHVVNEQYFYRITIITTTLYNHYERNNNLLTPLG